MRIRIVSDGTGRDTQVYAVGDDGAKVLIQGVHAVEWSVAHPRGRAEAKLTVRADVDVEAELTEWRPQPRDPTIVQDGMGLAEYELPGWLRAVVGSGFLLAGIGAAIAVAVHI